MNTREKLMAILIFVLGVYIINNHYRTEGCRDLQIILDDHPYQR